MKNLIFIFSALLASCSSSYLVTASHDKTKDVSVFELRGNKLKEITESDEVGIKTYFELSFFVQKSHWTNQITITCFENEKLDIKENESLVIQADSSEITLSAIGPEIHSSENGIIESATYLISDRDLSKILNSKKVELKIVGGDRFKKCVMTHKNISNINRFHKEYTSIGYENKFGNSSVLNTTYTAGAIISGVVLISLVSFILLK